MKDVEQTKNWDRASRDLLIELKTEMSGMRTDIRELKTDLSIRVTNLEQYKHDKEEAAKHAKEDSERHKDFEDRLRRLERYGSMAVGGLMLLQVGLKFIKIP